MRGGLLINYAESYDSASCLIRKIYLGQYWKIFDMKNHPKNLDFIRILQTIFYKPHSLDVGLILTF